MPRPRSSVVVSIVTAILLIGCGGSGTGRDAGQPGSRVHSYTLRGRILEMPTEPGGKIQLEHEAIHDLIDARGEMVGMDAMVMFFTLADDAGGEAFEVGQIVEFELEIDWTREPLAVVTRLERLPDDTELRFEAARPPS